MDKEHNELFLKEERRRMDKEQEFKNEFVENNEENLKMSSDEQQAAWEANELGKEPNGMDPEERFEKGLSFLETPDEVRSQRMDRFGKEPNSVNPKDER